MAYDDNGFGTIFPTRTGRAVGSSRERQMLDGIGGSSSFRTVIRNNPDGSTTMLRTKNGMPEFTTTTTTTTTEYEPTPKLLCRLMSDLYPVGAQRSKTTTINAIYSWPYYPVADGEIPKTNIYNGVYSTKYDDTQGGSTWYDTRDSGRQFSHVLSWASVAYDGQCGIGQGYDSYLPYVIPAATHSYAAPWGSGVSNSLGMYFPGQIVGIDGHYRYTYAPRSATKLYRNGVSTGISAFLLGACSVMIGGVEFYRTIEQCNYNQSSNRYALCISTYSTSGALQSTVNVILPASVVTVTNIAHSFRWNAVGTEAAGALQYTNSEGAICYDIFRVWIDGSASIVSSSAPVGRLRTAANDNTPTPVSTSTAYSYDDCITSQIIVALDYIGETLVWLRHKKQVTTYGSGQVTFDKDIYDYVTNITVTKNFGTRRNDTLVVEPAGTVLYSSGYDSSGAVNYSEVWTWGPDPIYPEYPWLQVRTSVSSSDTSSSATQPWRFLAGMCCDLRHQSVFVVESVETAIGVREYTYSATGAGARTLSRTSRRTRGTQGLECNLVTPSGATHLGTVVNSMIYREAEDPVTTVLGDVWPYVWQASSPITANTMTTGWSGAHSADSPNILSLQGKLSKSGKIGVFSLAHTVEWPASLDGMALANFGAINKIVRKTADGYATSDLTLPSYSGAFKWLVEPLILE